MSLYRELLESKTNLAVVGLGYVGMPIAVAFAKKGLSVIGFDLNKAKIDLYKSGVDPTNEVGNGVIAATTVRCGESHVSRLTGTTKACGARLPFLTDGKDRIKMMLSFQTSLLS